MFYIITIVLQMAQFLKFPLFIAHQAVPFLPPHICPENNGSHSAGVEYIFTTVTYSPLLLLRFVETLILQIHVYKFLFVDCTSSEVHEFTELCIISLKQKTWITKGCFCLLFIFMLPHALSIPAIGIVLEIKHSGCKSEFFLLLWIMDIIRFLYDVLARMLLVLATMAVGHIWSENRRDKAQEDEDAVPCPEVPTSYAVYLEDRKIASQDHSKRSLEYIMKGRKVERIHNIFQTWFILPWVFFFIASSLKTDQIISSWRDTPSVDGEYDLTDLSYMNYDISQLFLLLLPYLCSKKMNTHHHKYVTASRKQQLSIHKRASRKAFAHLNKIEKEEHFDFVPRIWGTSIKVPVENPMYILFLVIQLFFTVVEGLV
jgi:hypothetical protein